MELPFLTRVDSLEDIVDHPFWLATSLVALTLMAGVPLFHIYFWTLVWSLRRRMCMEIAIDYNENARAIVTRKEAQKQMSIFVLSQVLQRKQTTNGD